MRNTCVLGVIGLLILLVGLSACEKASPTSTLESPGGGSYGWWNKTVFYEIFVRSYYDSNGDGVGDFNGINEKLDYLNDGNPETNADLGITGLWLMPIQPSPSYHGYDVTGYYTVNPDYGSMEDFKRLLYEAHERGIRVTIDLVLNHTSVEHPWFIEARDNPDSERRDWYIWSEDKLDYLGPWGQQVWHPSVSGYYYGIFWSGMPDLNYTNPEVSAEMESVARFWLEDVGVDGFRLDAARHLIEDGSTQENTDATHAWWKNFRLIYKTSNPEALAIGEIWTTNYAVVTYLRGDELDLAFDFDLAGAIINGVSARDARDIQDALKLSYRLFGSSLSATFLTNHDMDRVMNQLGKEVDKAKLAAAVLLTAPGVPFIYYGEEIGMTGKKPDELIRTPMQWSTADNAGFTTGVPWQSVNSGYEGTNVAVQSEDPTSLLSHYRGLIHLRANHAALQAGEYIPVESKADDLIAFLRVDQEDIILVIINLNEKPARDYALTLEKGPLLGDYQAKLLLGGEAELADMVANDKGGFASYQPLSEIPGGGTIIVQMQP